jgi:subtilisin family serine protease
MGYVSVAGPESLFGTQRRNLPTTAKPFRAKAADRKTVGRELEKIGFTIIAASRLGFSVAGPAEAYEELTAGRVRMHEKSVRSRHGRRSVTHVDISGRKQPREIGVARARSARLPIDGIALDQVRRHLAISAEPPDVDGFYLKLPDDVAKGLRADQAHAKGARGAGVCVAMPDSGMAPHPYYAAHGYQLLATEVALPDLPPDTDPEGHGTAECANIFAIAPECEVLPIRCSDEAGKTVGGIAGFSLAKEKKMRIITCSWSADLDIGLLESAQRPPDMGSAILGEILDAIDDGILVVFAAGNGNFSLEPQVTGVLAAGGVFMSEIGAIRTSDLASAYKSPWFPEQNVPTVCGLAGMSPDQYIMMPVAPGSLFDVDHAGDPADPDMPADGTTPEDGWARFSGTSAAAPQLAGAAAALLSLKPNLTAAQIIDALVKTARDVTTGGCHPIFTKTPEAKLGPDVATGAGLIDLGAAVAYAQEHFA